MDDHGIFVSLWNTIQYNTSHSCTYIIHTFLYIFTLFLLFSCVCVKVQWECETEGWAAGGPGEGAVLCQWKLQQNCYARSTEATPGKYLSSVYYKEWQLFWLYITPKYHP